MEHVWTVFCRRVITDRETNQVTLVDSIESVQVKGSKELLADESPRAEFECNLVSLWGRSSQEISETGVFRVTLFDPRGAVGFEPFVQEVDLTEKRRMRSLINLPGVPLRGQGRYVFGVELETGGVWSTVARIPYELEIELVESEG